MTTSTTTINNNYSDMAPSISALRAAVLGSHFVKAETYTLLPHPSSIDTTSGSALQRYDEYLASAEFDEIAGQTLKSWLGRMKFSDTDFGDDFPDKIDYLIENADNDGTSLVGLIEQTASEVMQVGFQVCVAEYLNAPVAGENLSQEQAKNRNIRAAIKTYDRESVIDWSFMRINGVLQLSYLKLVECRSELNIRTGAREDVTEYLVLALDEEGNYYWQKFDEDTSQEAAEMNYVTVSKDKKPLKWLPVEIISAMEIQAGKMPKQLGMISPIATACLERYRVSAQYKEAMRYICPTTYTSGWTSQAWEVYKEVNGVDYIPVGNTALPNLPQDVTMEVLNPSMAMEAFERYFESNQQKITAYGGVWPNENGQTAKTATQSDNESSEVTSRLVTLADNIESSYSRLTLYCLMMEGVVNQDNIENSLDLIEINLPSDFARSKLTAQEQKEVRDNYLSGIYGRDETIRILVRGGVTVSDVETILAESDGGSIVD